MALSHVAEIAMWTRNAILSLEGSKSSVEWDVYSRFGPTMNAIERVEIVENLQGAFDFEGGVFRLSAPPLRALIAYASADMAAPRDGAPPLDEASGSSLLRQLIMMYFLHEARHVSQGIGAYSDVQELKKLAGPSVIADLDLIADRDAAYAVAVIASGCNPDSRFEVIQAYQSSLFQMVQYCLPVFDFPLSRAPKMARAVGLVLMLARLAKLVGTDNFEGEDGRLPLDACLICKVDAKYSGISIMILEPSPRLLDIQAAVDTDVLAVLAEAIDRNEYFEALQHGCHLLSMLGIIPS